jgi:protein-tyrosine phosphatase
MKIFQIDKNLYQSSLVKTKRDIAMAKKFDVCFDLTVGIDINADDFKIYINCPIVDGPVLPDMDVLMSMAVLGHLLAYKKKLKVLVHCNQGINRASLLVGSILHVKGMKGERIVKHIRLKRKGALSNPYFEKHLCSLK